MSLHYWCLFGNFNLKIKYNTSTHAFWTGVEYSWYTAMMAVITRKITLKKFFWLFEFKHNTNANSAYINLRTCTILCPIFVSVMTLTSVDCGGVGKIDVQLVDRENVGVRRAVGDLLFADSTSWSSEWEASCTTDNTRVRFCIEFLVIWASWPGLEERFDDEEILSRGLSVGKRICESLFS